MSRGLVSSKIELDKPLGDRLVGSDRTANCIAVRYYMRCKISLHLQAVKNDQSQMVNLQHLYAMQSMLGDPHPQARTHTRTHTYGMKRSSRRC